MRSFRKLEKWVEKAIIDKINSVIRETNTS